MRTKLGIAALLFFGFAIAIFSYNIWRADSQPITARTPVHSPPERQAPVFTPPLVLTETPPAISNFCGKCHELPPPDCEPRFVWDRRIRRMYEIAQRDLKWPEGTLPPVGDVIEFYQNHAPVELLLDPSVIGAPPSELALEPHVVKLNGFPVQPAVSHVKFVQLFGDGPKQLLFCDMRHGVVAVHEPLEPSKPAKIVGRVSHPGHAEVVDLDQDGVRDILVADLGVLLDEDTRNGAVIWFRGRGDGEFEPITLFDGLGRVADVQTADFDRDGDLDMVVAVFGHFVTGMLIYYENFTEDYSDPDFVPRVLDNRTGAISVPIVDLNNDGLLDVVTVLAQEHETVLAFLNKGRGPFYRKTLYTAPHPRWGSTGVELVDLDRDGDMDVLYNHGDAFDLDVVRPYHGFGWLENQGTFPFTYHRLAYLPGVHSAKAGDLDGDGDLDLIASAFMPIYDVRITSALETIVWLEQTAAGQYKRYFLKTGGGLHPSMDLADYDGDGDTDIALGYFMMPKDSDDVLQSWAVILENRHVIE